MVDKSYAVCDFVSTQLCVARFCHWWRCHIKAWIFLFCLLFFSRAGLWKGEKLNVKSYRHTFSRNHFECASFWPQFANVCPLFCDVHKILANFDFPLPPRPTCPKIQLGSLGSACRLSEAELSDTDSFLHACTQAQKSWLQMTGCRSLATFSSRQNLLYFVQKPPVDRFAPNLAQP